MKANKFLSILMLAVMAFATCVSFSSCGDDAPAPTPGSQNTLVMDGKSYTIDLAQFRQNGDGTITVAVGNYMQGGYVIDYIQGFGESVTCRKIEFDEPNVPEGERPKARNANVTFLKDGDTYTVKFNDMTFVNDHGTKTWKGSLNYVGKLQKVVEK